MASSDITCVVKSLQALNLDTVDEKSGSELGNLFDTCIRLKSLIDNSSLSSNADTIQVLNAQNLNLVLLKVGGRVCAELTLIL